MNPNTEKSGKHCILFVSYSSHIRLGTSQAYFAVVVGSFSSKLQKLKSLIIGKIFKLMKLLSVQN